MDVVHQRCAGLDIAKRSVTVCVRVAGAGSRATSQKVTTWGSMTNQILALREHLLAEQVSCVVMEATGDYGKPFYYLLEDAGFELMLVNARHVKNMPGRKTDVSDAAWLAQLAAHGLVRACLVPPAPVRELRDLTRTRTVLTRDRSREILRLEKVLEAGIKLSSVVSELNGVSSRAMLRALAAGERDPATLADLAQRRLRPKIGQLTEALTGRFSDHHAFLTTMHLDVIDHLTAKIDELDQRIEVVMEPFRAFHDLICTIPSVSQTTAQILIAETGGDMTRFPTADHLTSWAGVCPGSHESAGRVKSTKIRPGNAYLKGALGICALSIARSNNTHLAAKYRRIASRRGPSRAVVASERTLLVTIWTMAHTGAHYQDPGPDYYLRLNPERAKRKALAQLASLGYNVTIAVA